jgi:hypothetical protein
MPSWPVDAQEPDSFSILLSWGTTAVIDLSLIADNTPPCQSFSDAVYPGMKLLECSPQDIESFEIVVSIADLSAVEQPLQLNLSVRHNESLIYLASFLLTTETSSRTFTINTDISSSNYLDEDSITELVVDIPRISQAMTIFGDMMVRFLQPETSTFSPTIYIDNYKLIDYAAPSPYYDIPSGFYGTDLFSYPDTDETAEGRISRYYQFYRSEYSHPDDPEITLMIILVYDSGVLTQFEIFQTNYWVEDFISQSIPDDFAGLDLENGFRPHLVNMN